MIPTPANMTKTPVTRPRDGDRVVVAVADGRDRHEAPPQCVASGRDVRVGRLALELDHQDGRDGEDDEGRQDGDEGRVLAAVVEHILDQPLTCLATQHPADACQPTEAEEAQQAERREERRSWGSSPGDRASRAGRRGRRSWGAHRRGCRRSRPGRRRRWRCRRSAACRASRGCSGSSSRTMTASDMIVRTRMKMSYELLCCLEDGGLGAQFDPSFGPDGVTPPRVRDTIARRADAERDWRALHVEPPRIETTRSSWTGS